MVREFADGRCFACTVDASHHDHHRLLSANVKLLLQWQQQIGNGLNQQSFHS